MDKSVFQTDAVKVDSIARLLRQADDMLGDVRLHLHDYGTRLGNSAPATGGSQNCELELDQLKQSLSEKEEEARIARLERVQAFEELRTLRETVTEFEARLAEAEQKNKQLIASSAERRSGVDEQKQLLQSAQTENQRLRTENDALKRRLARAHEHNERLLRTREELLDTLKLNDVVARPSAQTYLAAPAATVPSAEIVLLEPFDERPS